MQKSLVFAALLFLSVTSFAQTWSVDKDHAKLGFTVTHEILSEVDGNFKNFDATITAAKPDLSDAVIELSADVNSVDTGNERRDEHLKSDRFFDAAIRPNNNKMRKLKSQMQPMTIKEKITKDEAAIRELIDRFAKAFHVKDVDGCMSVFAPEIVSFDILPPLQAVGAEAFVKHWEEFFDSYEGPIHVEFPDVRIATGNDVAFSYCLHRIAGTLKNGHKTDFWLRWTAGWRKTNGKWLIVHEQVSVPIDFRSGKALLDLQPPPPPPPHPP